MFRRAVILVASFVLGTGLVSAEEIAINCEPTPESAALCTIRNSSADDLVLLLNDGSLQGPLLGAGFGKGYVPLSIRVDRYESVLQYGPTDLPLWEGDMFHPSVCITPERLSEAVILPSGAEARITVEVSALEVGRRLRGHVWRMKFKTVGAFRTTLKRVVAELGGDWVRAFSNIGRISKNVRLVLASRDTTRRYICTDDENAISDVFAHLESPEFEVRRFAPFEE